MNSTIKNMNSQQTNWSKFYGEIDEDNTAQQIQYLAEITS
jgi:hypothetical protein